MVLLKAGMHIDRGIVLRLARGPYIYQVGMDHPVWSRPLHLIKVDVFICYGP